MTQRTFPRIVSALLFVLVLGFAATVQAQYNNIAIIEDYDNNLIAFPKNGAPTMQIAATNFYQTHEDDYDFLFIALDYAPNWINDAGYLPGSYPTAQAPSGTGAPVPTYNPGQFGSAGRLKLVGDLFSVYNYSTSPDEPYKYETMTNSPYSQVGLVTRQMMRYWGAYATIGGSSPNAILGGNGYWSYFLHTGGSVLGGNKFREMAPNEYMADVVSRGLSQLDLYLMGMLAPDDVDAFFYLTGAESDHSASDPPDPEGEYISHATAVDLTIDDIIASVGARTPGVDGSQKNFTCAFALVVVPGGGSATLTAKLDALRLRFQRWFKEQTNNLGEMDCTLAGTGEDGDSPADGDTPGCGPGDKRCNLNILEQCNNSGSWLFVENCESNHQYCVVDECSDEPADGDGQDDCTPDDKRCRDNMVEVCQSQHFWLFTENCDFQNLVCKEGTCVDPSTIEDGDDVTEDGDEPAATDGDTSSGGCRTTADCPEGQRCTSSGDCMPCPEGMTLDGSQCVETEGGGGGGCSQTGAAGSLLFLAMGWLAVVFLRRRERARK